MARGVFMKTHTLWITSVALCLSACGKQEPAAPQQAPESEPPAAPVEEAQVTSAGFDEAFISHMHDHAEKLDELMFALADDDLLGAATPAYWLSQHDAVDGVPEEWQNYLTGMRNAAYEVETANDLETARAAAEQLSAQCQGCHSAAGVKAFE
jgi:mono/diheme cytochrome c family protein